MRLKLDLFCNTPAFQHAPPFDLLGEAGRILEDVVAAIKRQEIYIPNEAGLTQPRPLHDIIGNRVGEVWFEYEK